MDVIAAFRGVRYLRARLYRPSAGRGMRCSMIIDRHIRREQLVAFTFCFLGLLAIFVTARLMQLTELLVTTPLTLADLLVLVLLAMPKLMLYVLPAATLLSLLIVLERLTADNELLVLQMAGLSWTFLWRAFAGLVIAATVVTYSLSTVAIPRARQAFVNRLTGLDLDDVLGCLEERRFMDRIPGMVLFFRSIDRAAGSARGVLIQDSGDAGARTTLLARQAEFTTTPERSELGIKLLSGCLMRDRELAPVMESFSFRELHVRLPLEELLRNARSDKKKGRREMTLGELREKAYTTPGDDSAEFAMELHQRLAFPAGCLLLCIVALPVGVLARGASRTAGIVLGSGLFLAYHVLFTLAKGAARSGTVTTALCLWAPNLVLVLLGWALWRRLLHDVPARHDTLGERISAWLRSLKEA